MWKKMLESYVQKLYGSGKYDEIVVFLCHWVKGILSRIIFVMRLRNESQYSKEI